MMVYKPTFTSLGAPSCTILQTMQHWPNWDALPPCLRSKKLGLAFRKPQRLSDATLPIFCPSEIIRKSLFWETYSAIVVAFLLVRYRIYRILNHIKIILNIIKPYLVGGIPTPLKNISQLGWLFPTCGKIMHVPNHQPVIVLQNYQKIYTFVRRCFLHIPHVLMATSRLLRVPSRFPCKFECTD